MSLLFLVFGNVTEFPEFRRLVGVGTDLPSHSSLPHGNFPNCCAGGACKPYRSKRGAFIGDELCQ